eukprot:CAMPEP_0206272730 /NCGR_PEP_ID=MMETSP0047_2-20121206/34171_1 /ASSEMBLY_ACC=CAM_ASM_000192 /TAXON_ID=195065 /ORGANISM="Chroomonas mesostigmatica_cf, Strain CCMP1168" /LENGTH=375 /DNA_ID=CAMNT_0053701685 /DNA_START=133 /DNA_END=1256 /DNA_ORIENTATION=-
MEGSSPLGSRVGGLGVSGETLTLYSSLRLHPAWLLAYPVQQFCVGLSLCALVALGLLHRPLYTSGLLTGGSLLSAMCMLMAAIGYSLSQDPLGIYWLLFAISSVAFAAVVAFKEAYLVAALLFEGAYLITLDLAFYGAALGELSHLSAAPPITGLLCMLWGLFAHVTRARVFSRSARLIEVDIAIYDEVWDGLTATKAMRAELKALKKYVQKNIAKKCNASLARQYNRLVVSNMGSQRPTPTTSRRNSSARSPVSVKTGGSSPFSNRGTPARGDRRMSFNRSASMKHNPNGEGRTPVPPRAGLSQSLRDVSKHDRELPSPRNMQSGSDSDSKPGGETFKHRAMQSGSFSGKQSGSFGSKQHFTPTPSTDGTESEA